MRTLLLILVAFSMSSFMIQGGKPAKVKIVVIDENSLIVEGASVTIYENAEDYKKEQNPIAMSKTNEKGFVQFKNLKEKVYYLHIEKGDLNNNRGNVKTGKLETKGKNRFEIMIN
ncbi:MAG: hypothetical protein ABFS32_08105 [Bacteroidota bacterium]